MSIRRAYAVDSSLFPSLDASLTGTCARAQSSNRLLPLHSTVYKRRINRQL